jgi:thiol-disulfide isomerase/thioredoxin
MDKLSSKVKWKVGLNIAFIIMALSLIFVPSAKAFVIKGLIEIGLYNPTIDDKKIDFKGDLATIRFKDVNGNEVSLADFKGKVIFLNFWATWCPPCLAEMPSINQFYEQFKGDKEVVFIMVDANSNFKKAQAYMDRKKYKLPVYAFASNIPKNIYKGSLPTTLVFDKKGRISFQGEGAANYSSKKFISFIEKLKTIN